LAHSTLYLEQVAPEDVLSLGTFSPFTCPDCHGTLVQLEQGGQLRFRCHTGHAYEMQSLLVALTESIEETLWSSLRAQDEESFVLRHMAEHLRAVDRPMAAWLVQQATAVEQRGEVVRQVVEQHELLTLDRTP
jgi:two-component system chemotaxis response regulator CheB